MERELRRRGGDNVARAEEGGEKDPGHVGGQEEEGGETEGLLRENQSRSKPVLAGELFDNYVVTALLYWLSLYWLVEML